MAIPISFNWNVLFGLCTGFIIGSTVIKRKGGCLKNKAICVAPFHLQSGATGFFFQKKHHFKVYLYTYTEMFVGILFVFFMFPLCKHFYRPFIISISLYVKIVNKMVCCFIFDRCSHRNFPLWLIFKTIDSPIKSIYTSLGEFEFLLKWNYCRCCSGTSNVRALDESTCVRRN